ncbi:hypothetical protein [Weeksella virosa]|uniref:Secreted protein n=1 Tax=Weeksella virosa (strain ATCC 43766 / DSM 16922 / JCM 21250 / CCUG 30538 / CDC 9751 / IAM 14551 / NBRC 16016 / NCTC 11634 / CL345/78) TaxID=865938 RepID=F0NZU0_WEEVC|nr:hypothetical protein [Weeksella virosa]ADX68364.1 hypothetical protein Weevi_1668 [Weeksella virosa DSM 16922]VEH63992.1 Uncharacterised protein [Weeksella virosa]
MKLLFVNFMFLATLVVYAQKKPQNLENKQTVIPTKEQRLTNNQPTLSYHWQNLVGKKLSFAIHTLPDNFPGFDYLYVRKDQKNIYAPNQLNKTSPNELMNKTFKVLRVEENFRNKQSEICILLFIENLSPSNYLRKQFYYIYNPNDKQPFLFTIFQ